MAPKPPPPPTTLTLRGKRDSHPGTVDKKRAKRTPAQMEEFRAGIEAKKQMLFDKKESGIQKAARIEDELEDEDEANDREGNNPPPTTTTKVLRPRPTKTPEPAERDLSTLSAPLRTMLISSVS